MDDIEKSIREMGFSGIEDLVVAKRLEKYNIEYFFYLCHIDNLSSILKMGILSKHEIEKYGAEYRSIADDSVQYRREHKSFSFSGKSFGIHDCAPLFFTPKTPMQYVRKAEEGLIILGIDANIIRDSSIVFVICDGNAACHNTNFYFGIDGLDKIDWDVIKSHYWTKFPDGKRKRSAEILIYPRIDHEYIKNLFVNLPINLEKAYKIIDELSLQISCEIRCNYFF